MDSAKNQLADAVKKATNILVTVSRDPSVDQLSACIGLLPAAISTGIGSQVQKPLATVVVGGMLIGPVIILVVVPALQTLFLEWTGTRGEPALHEDEPDLAEV